MRSQLSGPRRHVALEHLQKGPADGDVREFRVRVVLLLIARHFELVESMHVVAARRRPLIGLEPAAMAAVDQPSQVPRSRMVPAPVYRSRAAWNR